MRRRQSRLLISLLAIVAVVTGITQVIAFVQAPHASKASAAAATGTGGQFVPTQGRVLDTRNTDVGGYDTPMTGGQWRKVQVGGLAGVPSDGVSAVAVTFTIFDQQAGGYIRADKDEATPTSTIAYFNYSATGQQSNSAVLAVAANGKIQVSTYSATNLIIDVQGYYTADDSVAPGGYVPVTPKRLVDTRNGTGLPRAQLKPGSSTTLNISSLSGGSVPTTASAAMINYTIVNYNGTHNSYYWAYPTGTDRPGAGFNFTPNYTDTDMAQTGLSNGSMNFDLPTTTSAPLDILVEVVGYFAPGRSDGAFTPAQARVYDSRTSGRVKIPGNGGVATVQVGGINGVPLAGSGISAVTTNLAAVAPSGSRIGVLSMWADGTPRPGVSALTYLGGNTVSNLYTSALGANGAVDVWNGGPDPIDIVVDVEGWYSTVGSAITNGQTKTQQSVSLQADPSAGGSWVTYQYRSGIDGAFTKVPVGDVSDKDGNEPSSWPVQKNGDTFTAYTWNIRDTLSALSANHGVAPDGLLQVEACFAATSTDANPVCTMPSNVNFDQTDGGDAVTNIGLGALSEVTGDLELSANDADTSSELGTLDVGRTLSTQHPSAESTDADGIFGPGWLADLAGQGAGDSGLTVTDHSADGYILFTDGDGTVETFVVDPTDAKLYHASGDDAGDDSLVKMVNATTISMTQADGTTTTWNSTGGGSGAVWNATSVTQPGSGGVTYCFGASCGNDHGTQNLVGRILAPANGVDCSSNPDTTPGCRSLLLNYTTTSPLRLATITESLPQTAGAANKITVASYDYDSAGRLAHAWDPRLATPLKTAYTYTSANRLATMTPPGLATWSLSYDGTGRLSSVTRPDPSGQTATTTIVYGVKTNPADGGPVDLRGTATAAWGETDDLPVTGTAVFGPDHVPAGTNPNTVANDDWPFASIDFMDVNARVVNSADYGGGAWQYDVTQHDQSGQETWSLSERNRAQAIAVSASTDDQAKTRDLDPYVKTLTSSTRRAELLRSSTTYNPLQPGQVTDTYGPTHPVILANGSTTDARTHVATSYDEGAPNSDINPATSQPYGLPTSVVTAAYKVDPANLGDTTGSDSNAVKTGYDPIDGASSVGPTSGWTLGEATTSATAMQGASDDLVTKSRYDDSGHVIELRLPNDTDGSSPRTTLTTYNTTTGSGPCVDRLHAGLVCSTSPAAQPSSGAALPVVSYAYDQYGNPITKTESYGTGSSQVVRKSSTTYDVVERPITSAVEVTPTSAGGKALPVVRTAYDQATGLATTASTTSSGVTSSLTTAYDTLGRVVKYTDATGNVSTKTYDLSGNLRTSNNGKHTTTYTVDAGAGAGSSEHRGLVTGEDIGLSGALSQFQAEYDADANQTKETYPNGLVATRRYDNAGNLSSLQYSKDGSPWMTFTQDVNAIGQLARRDSPQSSQTFAYDADARLTSTRDTYQGACTTRTYGFDTHSNRTTLTANAPASDNSCSTSTTATALGYHYDDADRLTSDTAGNYTYDQLGRNTLVPSGDAKSTGSRSAVAGNLAIGYWANDMVASQQQGSSTMTYTLDPLQNRISAQTEGSVTTTNHFSSRGDSPAWTSTGSAVTEYAPGPSGGLAVTIPQTGDPVLDLVNPHGDVVATCADLASANAAVARTESTEYGLPRSASTASMYGWLGSKQRSTDVLGGVTVMGVRLYSPSTGRFTSTDPVAGGNENAYTYPSDPINESDSDGRHCVAHGSSPRLGYVRCRWVAVGHRGTWTRYGKWHQCSHVERSNHTQHIGCSISVTVGNTWSFTGSYGINVDVASISETVGYSVTRTYTRSGTYSADVNPGERGGYAVYRRQYKFTHVRMQEQREQVDPHHHGWHATGSYKWAEAHRFNVFSFGFQSD